MRKISKSRTEDDVISSTNGSVHNDAENDENDAEPVAKETANNDPDYQDDEGAANGDDNDDDERDDDTADASKETAKKRGPKSRGRPKKKKKGSKDTSKAVVDEDEEAEEEYEVEKVVDSKRIKGKLHYLIRWKGYSADSDTWEPDHTLSCPELIAKFEKENSKKKETPSKKDSRKRKSKEVKTPSKKPKTSWDSENADENAEYEVERILEVHHKKNGKREFLIHWKGWSNKFDSWEPENNLNCSDLIKKFMDKVDSARSSDSKNLRVAPGTTKRFTLQDPTHGRRLSKRRGQRQRVRYDDAE